MITKNTSTDIDSTTIVWMIIAFLTIIPGVILSGYVMTILWGWFILPVFGLAVPSIPLMLGISLLLYYITYQPIYANDDRTAKEKFIASVSYAIVRPLGSLLIGYIIHCYV